MFADVNTDYKTSTSTHLINRLTRFGSKVAQIGPKWVKSGTFCTETDLKKSQICPIWGQSDPIWMPNLTSLL